MNSEMTKREPPFTKEEAITYRALFGEQIFGCWWCLFEGKPKAYWWEGQVHFEGHRIACPVHHDRFLHGEVA